jgi:hypothetical protein
MNKFRDLSIGLFFIVATACIVSITFKVDTVVGKFGTTLTMTSAAAQQLSSTLKSQKEQLDEPEVVKARKDSQLQLAEIAKHLSQVTLKKFDQNLDSLNKTTKQAGQLTQTVEVEMAKGFGVVNDELLPSLAQTAVSINKISELTEFSSVEISNKITELIQTGTVTVTQVNQRLADPKFDELLAGAIELQRDGHAVLGKAEAVGANLDEATRPLGPMVRKAQKWQWVWNTGRLLGLLQT